MGATKISEARFHLKEHVILTWRFCEMVLENLECQGISLRKMSGHTDGKLKRDNRMLKFIKSFTFVQK